MNLTVIVPIIVATLPTLMIQVFALLKTHNDEKKNLDRIKADLNDLSLRIMRVEILSLCDHDRAGTERNYLMSLYDTYKKRGGNSYVDIVVSKKREELGL